MARRDQLPTKLAIIPGTTHYDLMLKATETATNFAKAILSASTE